MKKEQLSLNYLISSNDVTIIRMFTIIGLLATIALLFIIVISQNWFIVLNNSQINLTYPIIANIFIIVIFYISLKQRAEINIFGEIGFIYVLLASAYTIFPILALILTDSTIPLPVIAYAKAEDFAKHAWRHILFIFGISIGYIITRGTKSIGLHPKFNSTLTEKMTINILFVVIVVSIAIIILLSASVNDYYDHYTRFDHLSPFALRLVYVFLTLKSGGYYVLMSLMFLNYKKYKFRLVLFIILACSFETVYSFGSRIETLILLIAFVGLYHFNVKYISLKKGLAYLFLLVILFSSVEFIRATYFSRDEPQAPVSIENIKIASEFGAVFFTSFHLFDERENNSLPIHNWNMFFYDMYAFIPFIDHEKDNPIYWYARNYYPLSDVPPQTMGILADSAIWGGELDLLIRSLISGALFASIMRWFIQRRQKWWALTIYIYFYATTVMTLKYSVLYQFTPLIRVVLPVIVITFLLLKIIIFVRLISFSYSGNNSHQRNRSI